MVSPLGFSEFTDLCDVQCYWVLTNNPESLSIDGKFSFWCIFSVLSLLTNHPQNRQRSQGWKTTPFLYSGISPLACHHPHLMIGLSHI